MERGPDGAGPSPVSRQDGGGHVGKRNFVSLRLRFNDMTPTRSVGRCRRSRQGGKVVSRGCGTGGASRMERGPDGADPSPVSMWRLRRRGRRTEGGRRREDAPPDQRRLRIRVTNSPAWLDALVSNPATVRHEIYLRPTKVLSFQYNKEGMYHCRMGKPATH